MLVAVLEHARVTPKENVFTGKYLIKINSLYDVDDMMFRREAWRRFLIRNDNSCHY